MMIIAACLLVFAVLVFAEYGWRRGWLKNEFGRKFVHIVVGSFVAFWPLFLSWNQILFLSLAFVVVVSISKYLGIFKAIHAVQRPTAGEVFFALSVGILALLTYDGWIYLAALLHMSLADGMAALVGMKWGKSNKYKILGHTKSYAGTATFFVVSLGIIAVYSMSSGQVVPVASIVAISVGATILENLGLRGLDNISVPVWVALILTNTL